MEIPKLFGSDAKALLATLKHYVVINLMPNRVGDSNTLRGYRFALNLCRLKIGRSASAIALIAKTVFEKPGCKRPLALVTDYLGV
jgi:hypothetical protein